MTYGIKQLRELTDEQLIQEHDEKAKNTVAGTQYYIDELARRSRDRNEKAMLKLTIVGIATSIIAIVISIVAIFKS